MSRHRHLLVALAVVTSWSLAAMAPGTPASADQADEVWLTSITVDGRGDGYSVTACVGGVTAQGRTAEEIPHQARVFVNDSLVQTRSDAVFLFLPSIDGGPPTPGCDAVPIVAIGVRLDVAEIVAAGVTVPTDARWQYFDLRIELDIDGHTTEGSTSVAINGGPVRTSFEGAVPTPAGARLVGWILDPTSRWSGGFVVTVNGLVFPGGEPFDPSAPADSYPSHPANLPVADPDPNWVAAGLGTRHGIGILVPLGRICVHRLVDPEATAAEGFEPMGCHTTISGTPSGSIGSVTPNQTGARISGSFFSPWIAPDQQPLLFLVPDKGRPLNVAPATRRTGLGPEFGETTGAFDFRLDMPLPPGRRTVCLRDSSNWVPAPFLWWAVDFGQPRTLACREFQVPHAPVGMAEVIVERRTLVVRGWAVDLNGGSPRVLVWVNGTMRALTRTNEPNRPIQQTIGGDGRAGFTARIAATPGRHRVCTAWEDTTGGGWSTPVCYDDVVVK